MSATTPSAAAIRAAKIIWDCEGVFTHEMLRDVIEREFALERAAALGLAEALEAVLSAEFEQEASWFDLRLRAAARAALAAYRKAQESER